MNLFVDTSVWSLAWRRDGDLLIAEVVALKQALEAGAAVHTTGLVLQELLQGFSGPKANKLIIKHFSALPMLVPDRQDHIQAAEIRNACRRQGIQSGPIDALLAQLCIRHELSMLTTDKDFELIAKVVPLRLWAP